MLDHFGPTISPYADPEFNIRSANFSGTLNGQGRRKRPLPPLKEISLILENFAGLKQTFQAGDRYKPLEKPEKPFFSTTLSSMALYFFRQREVPHWSKLACCLVFPDGVDRKWRVIFFMGQTNDAMMTE